MPNVRVKLQGVSRRRKRVYCVDYAGRDLVRPGIGIREAQEMSSGGYRAVSSRVRVASTSVRRSSHPTNTSDKVEICSVVKCAGSQ